MSVHQQKKERRKYQIPESKTSHKTNGRTKGDEIYQKQIYLKCPDYECQQSNTSEHWAFKCL